jgi:hypothetical protein
MRIALGTFARAGIESHLGPDVATGVRAALLHYTRRIEAGRKPPEFPRFRRDEPPRAPSAALELAVEAELRRALERESRRGRGGPSAEQLAAHAVLVYLAALDAAADQPEVGPADEPVSLR